MPTLVVRTDRSKPSMVIQFKVDQVHPSLKVECFLKTVTDVDMMGWIRVSMNYHLREVFLLKIRSRYPEEGEKRKEKRRGKPLCQLTSLQVTNLTFPNRDIETRMDRIYWRFRLIKDAHLPWNEGRKRRTVSMNPHWVCRSARPTSRWAPKAHRMMAKQQCRHCKRSFGTNVLVSDKQLLHLSLAVLTSKRDVNKNVAIEQVPN